MQTIVSIENNHAALQEQSAAGRPPAGLGQLASARRISTFLLANMVKMLVIFICLSGFRNERYRSGGF
tara:strand:- start:708 stop:911 length:204 start_codon:yes stop_codon:yes gene_type:complete